MFIAVLFTITKIWKKAEFSLINELIKKKMEHIYNEILLGLKKELNLHLCDNMDGPMGCYDK